LCVTSILYRRVKAPNPTLSQGDGYPGEIWPEGAPGRGDAIGSGVQRCKICRMSDGHRRVRSRTGVIQRRHCERDEKMRQGEGEIEDRVRNGYRVKDIMVRL
jgi:hypothetical protein